LVQEEYFYPEKLNLELIGLNQLVCSSNAAFQLHEFTSYERDANGGDDAMMRRYRLLAQSGAG
jgi:hypothetical protein